jgi:hypothetical protein
MSIEQRVISELASANLAYHLKAGLEVRAMCLGKMLEYCRPITKQIGHGKLYMKLSDTGELSELTSKP